MSESAAVAPLEPATLPGRLQAIYLPAEAAMAWWGVPDLVAALREHGLPGGRAATARFAVPAGRPARLGRDRGGGGCAGAARRP
ncbi:hypothetical protein ABT297_24050 [Dactylosporangium sp. NPDC000555]|uniref:hypothetical protein n=1 Tax=Dactylosporangium sp. NPDC000555 TaxID=3154260 RepID=UPI0033194C65